MAIYLLFGVDDLPELEVDEHAMAGLQDAVEREEAQGPALGVLLPWQQIDLARNSCIHFRLLCFLQDQNIFQASKVDKLR